MTEIVPPDRGRERQASPRATSSMASPCPAHEAPGPRHPAVPLPAVPLPAVPLPAVPFPADLVESLVAMAARAPSLHNTQPWRFRTGSHGLELTADPDRFLPGLDPAGREMLLSCGAALFGLRLAIRQAGDLPVVSLLPDPAQPALLARVQLGTVAPATRSERQMLAALPHRHTHRGPFDPGPVAADLLARLRRAAAAEGATLCYVEHPDHYQQLATLVAAADRQQQADPAAVSETRSWTRPGGAAARDGVPAHSFAAPNDPQAGWPSVILTSGGTSGCWTAAAGRRPRPPCWSPPPTARPTGCAAGRRCTGCCCAPPAAGSSRACTASRSSCRRCGPRSVPGWPCLALRR